MQLHAVQWSHCIENWKCLSSCCHWRKCSFFPHLKLSTHLRSILTKVNSNGINSNKQQSQRTTDSLARKSTMSMVQQQRPNSLWIFSWYGPTLGNRFLVLLALSLVVVEVVYRNKQLESALITMPAAAVDCCPPATAAALSLSLRLVLHFLPDLSTTTKRTGFGAL